MMSLKNVWKKQGKTDLIRRKKSKSIQFSDEKFCKNGIKCNFAIPGVPRTKACALRQACAGRQHTMLSSATAKYRNKKMPSIRAFDSLICVYYRKTPVNRGIFIGVPGGSRTHGLSLRRRTLYPTELRKLIFSVAIIYLFLFFGKSFFFYRLSFLFALDFVYL